MKVIYTTKSKQLQVEIEGTTKDVFKQLAEFQEVFDERQCGVCQSEDIHFLVRTVEGNDFYELKCRKCGAKLAFGQNKIGGGLFPKRKLADGSYDKEKKGWHTWQGAR